MWINRGKNLFIKDETKEEFIGTFTTETMANHAATLHNYWLSLTPTERDKFWAYELNYQLRKS